MQGIMRSIHGGGEWRGNVDFEARLHPGNLGFGQGLQSSLSDCVTDGVVRDPKVQHRGTLLRKIVCGVMPNWKDFA